MSDSAFYSKGKRYVPTRVAAHNSGLSQNYVATLCRSGLAGCVLRANIWYVDEEALWSYLADQAAEKDLWRQRLSLYRKSERSNSHQSARTGLHAMTITPLELLEYHQIDRNKKNLHRKRRQRIFKFAASSICVIFVTFISFGITSGSPLQFTTTSSMAAVSMAHAVAAPFHSLAEIFSSPREKGADGLESILPLQDRIADISANSSASSSQIISADVLARYAVDNKTYLAYGIQAFQRYIETGLNVDFRGASRDDETKLYKITIALDNTSTSTALSLFNKFSDFGTDYSQLVVSLTPRFNGQVFYDIDRSGGKLEIFSDKKGVVSVYLMSPRKVIVQNPQLLGSTMDQLSDQDSHISSSSPEIGEELNEKLLQ